MLETPDHASNVTHVVIGYKYAKFGRITAMNERRGGERYWNAYAVSRVCSIHLLEATCSRRSANHTLMID